MQMQVRLKQAQVTKRVQKLCFSCVLHFSVTIVKIVETRNGAFEVLPVMLEIPPGSFVRREFITLNSYVRSQRNQKSLPPHAPGLRRTLGVSTKLLQF